MNYFEQELRRLFGNDTAISDKTFVGKAFFGKLTDKLNVRIEFVSIGIADRYDGIKATIINRNEGPVDAITLHFFDLFGRKAVSNPNFRDGIVPHIWKYGEEIHWYIYKPNKADYDWIFEAINNYLDVFREPSQVMNQTRHSENGLKMKDI